MTTNNQIDLFVADLNADERDDLLKELLAQKQQAQQAPEPKPTTLPKQESESGDKIQVTRTARRSLQSILSAVDSLFTSSAVTVAKAGTIIDNYEDGLLLVSADWHNDLAKDLKEKYGSYEKYVATRQEAIAMSNTEALLKRQNANIWLNR